MLRLDGVEVKVSVDRDQTPLAVRLLNLGDVAPWQVFFVEDVTVGLGSATPLLDQNLIIRARQKTRGKDDVTVKFRPGRRSQLADSWLDTTKTGDGNLDAELKVEQDWAGERRVLAISLTAECRDGLVQAVAAAGDGIDRLLSKDQRRFIEECAGASINLATLTMLPAVSAQRWPTFPVPVPGEVAVDVRAERWSVHELDFLELSAAVTAVEAAPQVQAALIEFVRSKGLKSRDDRAKTTQVLQHLVAAAAR